MFSIYKRKYKKYTKSFAKNSFIAALDNENTIGSINYIHIPNGSLKRLNLTFYTKINVKLRKQSKNKPGFAKKKL